MGDDEHKVRRDTGAADTREQAAFDTAEAVRDGMAGARRELLREGRAMISPAHLRDVVESVDLKAELERLRRLRRVTFVRRLWTGVSVVASALLQAYAISAFVRPAGLLSSGFTGIALLIERVGALAGLWLPASAGMVALNIPVALICWNRYTYSSWCSRSPRWRSHRSSCRWCRFHSILDDHMLQVVFGGFLYGFSVAIALRAGASTAGTDFISLMVSNRTGKSIWGIIFAANCVVLGIFGALFGWEAAAYSIVFQFISTKTIETFYHRYDRLTLQITTRRPDEVLAAYHRAFRHGSSCVEATGGYSREPYWVITTVVSSYELDDILHTVRASDEHAVVNALRTEQFFGGFYRGPLDA